MVPSLIVEGNTVKGVRTAMGMEIRSKAVVLTNGTLLNGVIHIGENSFGGGRTGEKADTGLTEQLESLGCHCGRMKTGTPTSLNGHSIDAGTTENKPRITTHSG